MWSLTRHDINFKRTYTFQLRARLTLLFTIRPKFVEMVPWWRLLMETFLRYWPFARGNHRSPVNSPHKGPWHGALKLSLICAWINVWVNKREAGELRRHQSHYDVTVILTMIRAWVVDNIHSFQMDVLAHPCPNPNGGLTKLPSVKLIY